MNDWGYLDTLGAWDEAAGLPEQLTTALVAAQRTFAAAAPRAFEPPRAVAAFGLGTAATACEAAAALAQPHLAVPLWVGDAGEVPAFVDEHTLVVAVSVTGDTEETLGAAAEAVARGARLVAVGGDAASPLGRLAAGAAANSGTDAGSGARWCGLEAVRADPPGRAGLGAATVTVLAALAHEGLVPDPKPSVTAASAVLALRRDAFMSPGGAPEELARRLGRTIPLVYGAAGVAATAARWWKSGVNRNAKAPAFAASVPALTYDELAGWGQSGDVTRQTMSLVLLRHAGEPPGVGPLFEAVRAATDEVMAGLFEIHGEGGDDLCRFFDLALVGELVSLHLAGREGVDPGPAPAIEESHPVGGSPQLRL